MMLGMFLEQSRIGFEALRQALGIIHAIDADRQRTAGQAAGKALHDLVVHRAIGIDAQAFAAGGRARRQRQAGAARGRQPGRPRARHRRRPHGLFQGPAAALRGLWPPAREASRASPQDPLPADLPALARGGRRVPQAARRARPADRPHQRPLLGVRLDAAALLDARRRRARPWPASTASAASAW